eukprot:gnl/Chilomastix_cuspidata/530.p1 GENE.gnl/Chilomastix_cuspidata/530~~gnl/Chilomastix_cuspidata/530.p1  ORF type:complete len:616 (+),score=229.20 gnl/Chilomastix_cuspidata/530:1540-3387(+)
MSAHSGAEAVRLFIFLFRNKFTAALAPHPPMPAEWLPALLLLLLGVNALEPSAFFDTTYGEYISDTQVVLNVTLNTTQYAQLADSTMWSLGAYEEDSVLIFSFLGTTVKLSSNDFELEASGGVTFHPPGTEENLNVFEVLLHAGETLDITYTKPTVTTVGQFSIIVTQTAATASCPSVLRPRVLPYMNGEVTADVNGALSISCLWLVPPNEVLQAVRFHAEFDFFAAELDIMVAPSDAPSLVTSVVSLGGELSTSGETTRNVYGADPAGWVYVLLKPSGDGTTVATLNLTYAASADPAPACPDVVDLFIETARAFSYAGDIPDEGCTWVTLATLDDTEFGVFSHLTLDWLEFSSDLPTGSFSVYDIDIPDGLAMTMVTEMAWTSGVDEAVTFNARPCDTFIGFGLLSSALEESANVSFSYSVHRAEFVCPTAFTGDQASLLAEGAGVFSIAAAADDGLGAYAYSPDMECSWLIPNQQGRLDLSFTQLNTPNAGDFLRVCFGNSSAYCEERGYDFTGDLTGDAESLSIPDGSDIYFIFQSGNLVTYDPSATVNVTYTISSVKDEKLAWEVATIVLAFLCVAFLAVIIVLLVPGAARRRSAGAPDSVLSVTSSYSTA